MTRWSFANKIVKWNIKNIPDCNVEAIKQYLEEQPFQYIVEHYQWITENFK